MMKALGAADGYKEVSRLSLDSRESRQTNESLQSEVDAADQNHIRSGESSSASRSSWRCCHLVLLACACTLAGAGVTALALMAWRSARASSSSPLSPPSLQAPSGPVTPPAAIISPAATSAAARLPDLEAYWQKRHPLADANTPLRATLLADSHVAEGRALVRACFGASSPSVSKRSAIAAAAGASPLPPFVLLMVGDSSFRLQYAALCSALDTRTAGVIDLGAMTGAPGAPAPSRVIAAASCTGVLGARRLQLLYVPATRFDAALVSHVIAAPPLPRPDAIYLGGGQWQMWPAPFVKAPYQWLTWPQYASFASDVNATVHAALQLASGAARTRAGGQGRTLAPSAPPAQVIVSTMHSVCPSGGAGTAGSSTRGGGEAAAINGTHSSGGTASASSTSTISQRDVFACGVWLMRTFQLPFATAQADCAAGVRERSAAVDLNQKLRQVLTTVNRSLRRRMLGGPAASTGAASPSSKVPAYSVTLVDAFSLTDGRCWANLDATDRVSFARLVYLEVRQLLLSLRGWSHTAAVGGALAAAGSPSTGAGGPSTAVCGGGSSRPSACNCTAASWRALGRSSSRLEAERARAIRRGRREEDRGQRRAAGAGHVRVVRGD